MSLAPDPSDRLAQVRTRFNARLAQDRALLEREGVPEADIVTLVHRIAGLAGTLGMAQLSEEAKLCERALLGQDREAGGVPPAIGRLIWAIDRQLAADPLHGSQPGDGA